MAKFKVIYIDLPWTYKDKALAGQRGAGCKYTVQSNEWCKNLPIEKIADKDCALFMWVTMPKLNECFDIIKSWGFSFKTCAFVWIKQNKNADSFFTGMGRWSRACGELCLIATKGKPKRINAGVHSVVMTHIEKHSKKPDEVRQRIVKLMGDVPRIEIFAREQVEGWTCIGNEIDGRDVVDVLNELGGDDE